MPVRTGVAKLQFGPEAHVLELVRVGESEDVFGGRVQASGRGHGGEPQARGAGVRGGAHGVAARGARPQGARAPPPQ
jgi:hypothetical protein